MKMLNYILEILQLHIVPPPMNVLVTDIVTNISIPCLVFQMIVIIFQVDNTMKLRLNIMN